MKALISSMIILGLISVTPAFAEKHAGSGKGQSMGAQAQSHGEAMQSQGKGEKAQMQNQQKMQHKAKEGKGEMHQEQHRELEKKQAAKATGEGAKQAGGSDSEKGQKWYKFWE